MSVYTPSLYMNSNTRKGLTPWWQDTTFYTGLYRTPYMCRCINSLPAWCSDPLNSWISRETWYSLTWLSTADVTQYPMIWLSTRWHDSAPAHATQQVLMFLSTVHVHNPDSSMYRNASERRAVWAANSVRVVRFRLKSGETRPKGLENFILLGNRSGDPD